MDAELCRAAGGGGGGTAGCVVVGITPLSLRSTSERTTGADASAAPPRVLASGGGGRGATDCTGCPVTGTGRAVCGGTERVACDGRAGASDATGLWVIRLAGETSTASKYPDGV